jgi:hypothetical protein
MLAEIAANDDRAAISIPRERYIDQVNGLDKPYQIVTCEIETIATIIMGIKNAAIINVL